MSVVGRSLSIAFKIFLAIISMAVLCLGTHVLSLLVLHQDFSSVITVPPYVLLRSSFISFLVVSFVFDFEINNLYPNLSLPHSVSK
jgi:hypothetical protein